MRAEDLGIPAVTYKQMGAIFEEAILMQSPLVIHGPPGTGKTELVHQIGKKLGYYVHTNTLGQTTEQALYGLRWPDKDKGITVQLPSDMLPQPDDERNWLIFFDELGNVAHPAVRMGIMQLLDKYTIGQLQLDRKRHFIAAAMNLGAEDGVHNVPLDAMAADRLVHVLLDLQLDEWIEGFAIPSGILPQIIGFLRCNPECFNPYNQGNISQTVKPTPRSWDWSHRAFMRRIQEGQDPKDFLHSETFQAFIAGKLGEATTLMLFDYCQNADNFAMIDEILACKTDKQVKSLMPKHEAGLYTLASGLPAALAKIKKGESQDTIERVVEACILMSKSSKTLKNQGHFMDKDLACLTANECINAIKENPSLGGLTMKDIEEKIHEKNPKYLKFDEIAKINETGDELTKDF